MTADKFKVSDKFKDPMEFANLLVAAGQNAKSDWDNQFIEDQKTRFNQYKGETQVSQKQLETVNRIAEGKSPKQTTSSKKAPAGKNVSRRDHFAALAMQALVMRPAGPEGKETVKSITTKSLALADAMMAALDVEKK